MSYGIEDGEATRPGAAADDRVIAADQARDLTQAFLVRHGATLIDPDKIGTRFESAARFRHDLRAKLSMLQTLAATIDRADEERREALAVLGDSPDEPICAEMRSRLSRCEGTIAASATDVPDVIEEFLPEAPAIDGDLCSGYRALLDCLRDLASRLRRD